MLRRGQKNLEELHDLLFDSILEMIDVSKQIQADAEEVRTLFEECDAIAEDAYRSGALTRSERDELSFFLPFLHAGDVAREGGQLNRSVKDVLRKLNVYMERLKRR
jgi:hypothetical protein